MAQARIGQLYFERFAADDEHQHHIVLACISTLGEQHSFVIGTIAEEVLTRWPEYRATWESLMRQIAETIVKSRFGPDARMVERPQ